MGKKNDDGLDKLVNDLIADVGDDRDRLVGFLEGLITDHADQRAGIAEYVAKLADALTRQNQVRANTIKAIAKKGPESDDDSEGLDDITKEIGLPFENESLDEGSN